MLKLPRTLRLDPSDALIFDAAATPGEWAVPGGFAFWDETPEAMAGKRRPAFRAGWLGLASFGWSTLVEVAEASAFDRADAEAALAEHIKAAHGAPTLAMAVVAAEDEIQFAAELCADHPVGTVLALARSLEGGEVKEAFRSLHRRETAPVFAIIEDEDAPAEAVDLRSLPDA
jgi:hypothetical protein